MDFISIAIIVAGVIVLVFLIYFGFSFSGIYKTFDDIIADDSAAYVEALDAEGNIRIRQPSTISYDRRKLDKTRDKYGKEYAKYVVASQIISLFPLGGIFGTVHGLITSRFEVVETLVAGLNTALVTTYVGLICSIVLKMVDAFFPGKNINLIDYEFDKADSVILRQTLKEEVQRAGKKQ